eukprot:gene28849-32037_t
MGAWAMENQMGPSSLALVWVNPSLQPKPSHMAPARCNTMHRGLAIRSHLAVPGAAAYPMRILSKQLVPSLAQPYRCVSRLQHPFNTRIKAFQTPADHELPKNFEPSKEVDIYNWWESEGYSKLQGSATDAAPFVEEWESEGYFKPQDTATDATPFVLTMPPPNVTGKLHMGHAMFATIQDVMVRYARMNGRPTLWLPGTDHAGIATQTVVEKMMTKEGGPSRKEMGREAFTERVWEWKKEYGGFITNQLRRLGASCDWTRERFTLDDGLSAFVRLHSDGLVYRGSYMVNWSPTLMTAVSDLEVDYTEEAGFMFYFKYPIEGTDDYLPVASTRPETILGDTAVAVHPDDERYKHLVGKRCVVPCGGGRTVPIIADDYVDMEFGTGALKITPGHDPSDYEIGKRCNLETINIMNKDATLNENAGKKGGNLEAINIMNKDATLNENAGKVPRSQRSGEVIEPLSASVTAQRVPRSQRSGEVIEPIVSEQWFVRMKPLAEPALAAVADGTIKILPDRFERVYNNWLGNIKDWCVSRQLWWGHRIPVWYVFDSEADAEASEDKRSSKYVVARNDAEALIQAKAEHGEGVALRQEEDVLDTWFSSGLWPFSTLGWPNEEAADYKKFYPTQVMETGHDILFFWIVMETGHDILFFWVARMIMMGLHLTGKAPFETIYLHGLVRDDKGRKMSKSLGNVVDPLDVMADYGTDALRFTLATGTTVGQDVNLSMERVNANRSFTNKIWNAGKYVIQMLQRAHEANGKYVILMLQKADEGASASGGEWSRLASSDFSTPGAMEGLSLSERYIISMLHQITDEITDEVSERHDKMDYNAAGISTYNFFWDEFADWFIEVSKPRTYGSDAETAATTRAVLVYVLDRILRLLHPFMPYVTEEICEVDSLALSHFEVLKGIVRSVRNMRVEYNVEVGRKVGATIVVTDAATRASIESELAGMAILAEMDLTQLRVAKSVALWLTYLSMPPTPPPSSTYNPMS